MVSFRDMRCDMAQIAYEKGVSYELVEFMCRYCEEKLGKTWEETLELVRRTLL